MVYVHVIHLQFKNSDHDPPLKSHPFDPTNCDSMYRTASLPITAEKNSHSFLKNISKR